jgi:hypothetical protein
MLERAFEPPAHEPRVESVMAVLDENGALSETKERPTCVPELRRSDQHRTVDMVALLRVRVYRRAAVDERVKEGKRAGQLETLGAQLQDEERCVAGRLDVDRDELGVVQRRLRAELRRVDGDLLPRYRLRGAARLEEDGLHDGRLSAPRMNCSSSRVIALRSNTAAE